MFLGKLGEQFTLKSKKAFNQLNFEQSILAEKDIYFPKKNERDTMARKEFTEEKRKSRIEDETYVLDIIRQKWKNEDERLRRILLK